MQFANQLFSLIVRSGKYWLLDLGFKRQEMIFSDKNRVKSRHPCYLLSKISVLNRGLCWLKPCYPGTPCMYKILAYYLWTSILWPRNLESLSLSSFAKPITIKVQAVWERSVVVLIVSGNSKKTFIYYVSMV